MLTFKLIDDNFKPQRIREYLNNDSSDILAIHGPSGSGKTTLMAKAVEIATTMKSTASVFRYRLFRETLNKGLNKREFYFFLFFFFKDLLEQLPEVRT